MSGRDVFTVSSLRAHLERLEREGKGSAAVSYLDPATRTSAFLTRSEWHCEECGTVWLTWEPGDLASPPPAAGFEYCPPIETVCRHGKTLGPCPQCGETYNREQRAARRGP